MNVAHRWRRAAALAAILALLLVAVEPVDLPVMRAVARPDHPFARLVRRVGEWPGWLAVAVALARRRKGSAAFRRAARATLILALVHPLLITQSFKHLWGRVRYVDLPAYTPWWTPAGPGAGESFPSGHVAMATVVLPFGMLLARRRGWRRAMGMAALAWPVVVAAGRVVAGAHYPTDVIASLGLGVILATTLAGPPPGPDPVATRAPGDG